MDVDAATQTMIDNLPARTGRSLEQWFEVLDAHPYEKHGQGMAFLKGEHGMSHGFANLVVAQHRALGTAPSSPDSLVDAQYEGAKAPLRPLYDRILAAALACGPDVVVAPKKTGVSLRRSKQFALVSAPSSTRVEIGLNLRGTAPTERLRESRGMCTHRVDLHGLDDVDDELVGWLRDAYALA